MKNKKKILIFITCFNVENEIVSVFKRIPKKILKKNIFILAIDDNSNDNTFKKLVKLKNNYNIKIIKNKRNLGYGGVQKLAFDYAIKKNMDYAIMLHGDGQYDPKKLPKFISKLLLDKYDAVFGSRMHSYISAISGGMPLYKFFGNIFLTKIQNFILKSKLSEFHSGYRSYTVNSLKKINYKNFTNSFHFDTEIIIEFFKKKLSIIEIPIPTNYNNEISNLKSIPYGLNILRVMIKYKFKI